MSDSTVHNVTLGGNLQDIVGMHVMEFLAEFVRTHEEIQTLLLMSYRVTLGLEERLNRQKGIDDRVFDERLRVARERGVPLWVAMTDSYLKAKGAASELIDAALEHDKSDEKEIELDRNQVRLSILESIANELDPDFAIGVSSRVKLSDKTIRHIPMIDLRCGKSATNLQILNHFFRQIGQGRGVLLDSGRSYHYYGLDLLDEREWLAFMGRCLLLTPLVDTRYVAHRLIDNYGRLRISTSRNKPTLPLVVDAFDVRVIGTTSASKTGT